MTAMQAPNVAGLFYPADSQALSTAVRQYLQEVHTSVQEKPKALLVPHAGYLYSGPVAASAYAQLTPYRDQITRVLLFGPSHRMPFRGLVYSRAEAFLTPLGPVPVDLQAYEALADLPQVRPDETPFAGEHCLEVQLPFLQQVLKDFRILPFLVGEATAESVTQIMERLWDGEETLILISSDLSHYLDYEQARRLDLQTSRAIEALQPEAIGVEQACGRNPLRGLLVAAKRHGLRPQRLDLRNSGDTAGPRDRVVGYAAYAFAPEETHA